MDLRRVRNHQEQIGVSGRREKTTLIFVYGTLRRGFRNAWQKMLEKNSVSVTKATVRGFMYDLGEYPGAVYDPEGSPVTGELYEIREGSPEKLLPELDEYEGDEYERILVKALTEDGNTEDAYFYNFTRDTKSRRRIFPADYLLYLKKFP